MRRAGLEHPFMNPGENLRALTSLRFFAALWVILFHYWPDLTGSLVRPAFIDKGYLGVDLFFILSGFILCHVYRAAVEEGRFDYTQFLWNRLARVYPLHLATLVGMGVMAFSAMRLGFKVDPNILVWSSLPANLSLTQAWGLAPTASWNHPSWSISAEWFAYLTFPVFALVALRLKNRPGLGLALAMCLVLGLNFGFQALTGQRLTEGTISWGALRIVPSFAYGCALFGFWAARPAQSSLKALMGALFSGALTIFFIAVESPDSVIVLGLGLTLLFFAQLAQTRSAILTQGALVYLGEISYSMYMICIPWKVVFVNTMTRIFEVNGEQLTFPLWLVLICGLIPLSALSYQLIEKPARDGMKFMLTRRATHRSVQARA